MLRKIWSYLHNSEVSATTYAVVFRIGFAILGGAIFTVISLYYVQRELNERIEKQIMEVNQRFERISEEHNRAIQAADMALAARNEIYEYGLQRFMAMEKALEIYPNFDSMPVPDDLRLLINETCARDNQVSPPGDTAAGHSDTDKNKRQNSR